MDVGLVIWKEVPDDREVKAAHIEECTSFSAISIKIHWDCWSDICQLWCPFHFSAIRLWHFFWFCYSKTRTVLHSMLWCIYLFRMACRLASILSVLSRFCISSSSIFLRQTSGSISEVRGAQDTCSNMGETREEGLSYAVCAEEVANPELLSPIPNAPMVTWHIVWQPVL